MCAFMTLALITPLDYDMAEIYSNNNLTRDEMTGNVDILNTLFVVDSGFTINALAGMLGSFEAESTINPGRLQGASGAPIPSDPTTITQGFGLVQWTPGYANYISWAESQGYVGYDSWGRLYPQYLRIIYELENGLQYYPTTAYPETFREFSQSTKDPEYLARAFVYNYERPADPDVDKREENARYWYEYLGGIEPQPVSRKSKIMYWGRIF